MQGKLKALGLAMIAALAMSAVVASAAQAQFTASAYPATVTGTSALGNELITVDGSSVECVGHFQGTASAATTTLTSTPTYTNCKAFGASATLNMNGCDYVFHDTANNHQNKFTIVCPAGRVITIVGGNCEVQIGPQGPLGNLAFTNNGPHVTVQANLTGVTANRTKDGFLCPLKGLGHTTATYIQPTNVTFARVGGGYISVD